MKESEDRKPHFNISKIVRKEDLEMRKLTRREVLLGATGLSLGVMAALGGVAMVEQLRSGDAQALKPEHGDAQKSIVIEWLPDTVKRWEPQLEKYGNEYEIDPNLLAIMMTIESGGDPNANSGLAVGLMQVAPKTAEDIAVKYLKKPKDKYSLTDPDTNIEFATAYLRHLINLYGDANDAPSWDETVTTVASGYNGGFKGANAYFNDKWDGLSKYSQETFSYARYVRVMWQERHDPLSFTYYYWREVANGKALLDNAAKYEMKP